MISMICDVTGVNELSSRMRVTETHANATSSQRENIN